MKVRSLRRMLGATWLLIAALVTALAFANPASASQADASRATRAGQSALDKAQKAAAAQLAEDYSLSKRQARRRVARQDDLTDLASEVRKDLGARFGGAWIDHDRQGKLVVAVTRPSASARVRSAASAAQMTATATVTVDRSWQQLTRMSSTLSRRIAEANKGAKHGLQSSIAAQHNALELDLPKGKPLTDKQREVVQWAKRKFGSALLLDTYKYASKPLYCGGMYSCDPPLRSGLAIYGNNIRCTSAFMVYDSSSYYMMTAGHCAEASSNWWVPTYSYGDAWVGSVAGYTFGYYGDSAVVRINDAGFWQPRGWVYPQTRIYNWDYDYVGQYVCKQGSTTGYTCGQITDTNATVSYPNRTLTGMTWSTACVDAGDSGSGVYYGNTAHGILSGGPYRGCGMIHEPISRALSRWGVTLLSG